jgi:hypothetical protein
MTSSLISLDRDGFQLLDGFCGTALVPDLIRAVESLPTDAGSTREKRGVTFARRNLLEMDFVRALIERRNVRDLLGQIGPDLFPVRAILFDKTGAANWTVPWHQDRSITVRKRIDVQGFGPWSTKAGVVHVQPPVDILRSMVTLRFHLDPCGLENGPLRVVAGTHETILSQSAIESTVAEKPQSICATDAGGLLVMRPLILHASSPAVTPSHRRVIHVEFGPKDLPGGLHWAAA